MSYRILKSALLANLLAGSWALPASAQTLTVTDGLQLWLQADAGVTATGAGVVSAWADQSGKGNNASQPEASTAPMLVTDAGNGKPALRFDGADDFLVVADSESVSIPADITTFYAVKFDDFVNYRAVWAKTQVNQPAPNDWYALPNSGIPRAYRGDGTGANEYVDSTMALPAGQFLVAGYDNAGTKLTHYFGAVPTGSGHIPRSVVADAETALVIGSRDDKVTLMKGDIAEILIYNRALTDAERLTVVSYLQKKYLFGTLDPAVDTDQDGLTNLQEEPVASNPTQSDTDADGLSDGAEVNTHHTNPTNSDSDGDLLDDGVEFNVLHTDPTKLDTDGDTFSDYYEVHLLTDPLGASSKPVKTLVSLFTGPDPGEGLDLDGDFVYAINASSEEEGGTIRDATFTVDTVDGVSLVSSTVANGWNTRVNYGESADEMTLNLIMSSIRWSDAASTTPDVNLTFSNLEVGASYKLQALFSEYRWPRGFDVSIKGRLVVREFAPFQWQGNGGHIYGSVPANPNPRTNGVVITHSFIATTTDTTIRLNGPAVTDPAMTDHNAIIQAATVELIAPRVDSDSDGLSDAWENEYLGGLTQNGDADTDSDGLKNSDEFTSDTDPSNADTDGDGLNDGAEKTGGTSPVTPDTDGDLLKDGDEISIHKTDPTKVDSDEDGLADGAEVRTHLTDPTKKDTDGDTFEDGKEVATGTDPTKSEPATEFSNIVVASFSGGDPGEGLDLQGNFLYAVNVSSAGAAGKAGDADFTADNVAGVTVSAANNIANWSTPEYGDSEADNVMEKVTQSIRFDPRWRVELTGLVPESVYKLQLFFFEAGTGENRGFDVYADGTTLAESFVPATVQGGGNNIAAGAVVSAQLKTHRNKLVIIGDGPAAVNDDPEDGLTDSNAILDGFTLEIIEGGIPTNPPTLSVARAQANIIITYEGTLQSSDTVKGTYTDVAGTSPATIPASDTMKFYRAVRR